MKLEDFYYLDDRIPEELIAFSLRLLKEIDRASSGILVDAFKERLDNPLGDYSPQKQNSLDPTSPVGIFIPTNELLKLASEIHPFWLEACNKQSVLLVINFSSRDCEGIPALSLVIMNRSLTLGSQQSAFFAVDAQGDSISENPDKLFEVCLPSLLGLPELPKIEGFCCSVDFDYAKQHDGTLAPWYYVRDSHIFAREHAVDYANELERLFGAFNESVLDLAKHEQVIASSLEGLTEQALFLYNGWGSTQ